MSHVQTAPRSRFWPLTLLVLVLGLALCLHGAGLWMDLLDPQWTFASESNDVHISLEGFSSVGGGVAGVLLAAGLVVGLALLMLVGLPLLFIGIGVLVVASIAMALLVPLLGLGALFGFPLLLLILPSFAFVGMQGYTSMMDGANASVAAKPRRKSAMKAPATKTPSPKA